MLLDHTVIYPVPGSSLIWIYCVGSDLFSTCIIIISYNISVDSCVPGDIVTVSGIVKVNSIDEGIS